MRGNDQDCEAETPGPCCRLCWLVRSPWPILPWRGRGNVIAAAGVAILNLVGHV